MLQSSLADDLGCVSCRGESTAERICFQLFFCFVLEGCHVPCPEPPRPWAPQPPLKNYSVESGPGIQRSVGWLSHTLSLFPAGLLLPGFYCQPSWGVARVRYPGKNPEYQGGKKVGGGRSLPLYCAPGKMLTREDWDCPPSHNSLQTSDPLASGT